MNIINQIMWSGVLAVAVLFLAKVIRRVRVKVVQHNGHPALALGVEKRVALQLNTDMDDYDKQDIYEREIKPIVQALQSKLREHGVSGLALVSTVHKGSGHQVQGAAAFCGEKVTPDEMVIAEKFGSEGMDSGCAAVMAYLVKRGGMNEQEATAAFNQLAHIGLERALQGKLGGRADASRMH